MFGLFKGLPGSVCVQFSDFYVGSGFSKRVWWMRHQDFLEGHPSQYYPGTKTHRKWLWGFGLRWGLKVGALVHVCHFRNLIVLYSSKPKFHNKNNNNKSHDTCQIFVDKCCCSNPHKIWVPHSNISHVCLNLNLGQICFRLPSQTRVVLQ